MNCVLVKSMFLAAKKHTIRQTSRQNQEKSVSHLWKTARSPTTIIRSPGFSVSCKGVFAIDGLTTAIGGAATLIGGCCHHPRYRHRPPASALRCSPCASSGCPWADSSRRWSSRSEPPSTRQPSSHHCRGWQRGRCRGCQSSPPCPRG